MPSFSTIAITIKAIDEASEVLEVLGKNSENLIGKLGTNIAKMGTVLSVATAPIAAGLGAATSAATEFQETMTNTASVLGKSAADMATLNEEVLKIGSASRAGPQAAAEAFYDVVGGVADASKHIDILTQSIHLAEAGNSDLGGATKAMIAIMNSYQFEADQASYASDVLTKTVGAGVGTMDEFAAAMPAATGLAKSLGIEFGDLGAMTAFLTTKGNTASGAITQLSAMMTSLLNPNESMKKALKELGFASGDAAIKQLGLVGAMEAIGGTTTAATDGMAKVTGSVEALRGATSFAGDEFSGFLTTFTDGIDGATEAARALQLDSVAAQSDLLGSSLKGLAITVGNALLPPLNRLIKSITPIIEKISVWVQENPELVTTIVGIAGALVTLGPILLMIGTSIGIVGTAIGLIFSPIGLVIGAIAALAAAFATNFGGIRDFLQPIIDNVVTGLGTLFGVLGNIGNIFEQSGLQGVIEAIINAFMQMFGLVENDQMSPAATAMAAGITGALQTVGTFITGTVIPAIQTFFDLLSQGWAIVRPALESIADWFINTALPAVVDFVKNVVLPGIQKLFDFLAAAWEAIRPSLEAVFNWFVNEALPAVVDFVTNHVLPAVQDFFNFIRDIWDLISPALSSMFTWFTEDALPAIVTFITGTVQPAIEKIFNFIKGAWDLISPTLISVFDWFHETALPGIVAFIRDIVIPGIQKFIDLVKGIWNVVEPGVTALKNGIMAVLQPIIDLINNLIGKFNELTSKVNANAAAQTAAQGTVSTGIASGSITKQDVYDQSFKAVSSEFGGGFFGDLIARATYSNVANEAMKNVSGRAAGGPVVGGRPYMVGERGPELFVPPSSGSIDPNGGQEIHIHVEIPESVLASPSLDDARQRGEAFGIGLKNKLKQNGTW